MGATTPYQAKTVRVWADCRAHPLALSATFGHSLGPSSSYRYPSHSAGYGLRDGSPARRSFKTWFGGHMAQDFFLGESLVGDGNEVAHIDLMIGSKEGPVGHAFAEALTNNKDGFTTLLAVVTPNLPAKPDTILYNKVTIKGAKQAVQMFGPAQAAVARAVVDSVSSGV